LQRPSEYLRACHPRASILEPCRFWGRERVVNSGTKQALAVAGGNLNRFKLVAGLDETADRRDFPPRDILAVSGENKAISDGLRAEIVDGDGDIEDLLEARRLQVIARGRDT